MGVGYGGPLGQRCICASTNVFASPVPCTNKMLQVTQQAF